MKDFLKKALSLILCGATVFPLVACGKNDDPGNSTSDSGNVSQTYDPETRPLTFSIGALDNNFNPFFYTSANDGEIAGMTQIGMLSSDANGNPVCGEDEPTVVLDYKETMYDANNNVTTSGSMEGRTEYEFVIKNGIKFSDGVDLTIKDVLFNLYVYLDPAYTGSSTIYSTDIKGLNAYRAQDPNLEDDSDADYLSTFYATASQRISNIISYVEDKDAYFTDSEMAVINSDIEKVQKLFLDEITTDWTNNYGALESYEEEYAFKYDWQSYYLNEGIISVQTEKNAQGAEIKKQVTYVNEKGETKTRYLTSLDEDDNLLTEEMEKAMNDPAKIAQAKADYKCTTDEEAKEYIMRDTAIATVKLSYEDKSKLPDILRYWATGSNALEEFAAEERSAYYESKKEDGGLTVKTISGITTYKTSSWEGGKNGTVLTEEHDVLKIVINGIDPKAIWNFAFTVAPMHYYSDAAHTAAANGVDNFGVEFGSKDFFDDVLKDTQKNGLPVGAGIYKATDGNGSDNPDKNNFYSNNFVFFKRNTYFETVGEGISNAKIKFVYYKVVGDDKVLNALISGDIDYGTPSATTQNISKIGEYDYLSYKKYLTGGYGYIGINPKYVPDLAVRQAIMKAMNTSSIVANYYTSELADVIYRPMSKTSWAYPEGAAEWADIAFTTQEAEIRALVESAGWIQGSDGVYVKGKDRLKFTFTIAGETTDHPAYGMLEDARQFLNKCGFEITVATDNQALKKLASGSLQVWAAAWSSGIDPDMYQIYHKDSTATSVKNWGYPEIINDTTGKYAYEKGIVEELSTVIEEARQTLNQTERIAKYSEALDLVMQLAVELPTYQRNDLVVYNSRVIDTSTLNQNPSHNEGVISRLWEVNYN